jgi:hypothetical protein
VLAEKREQLRKREAELAALKAKYDPSLISFRVFWFPFRSLLLS